jgi:hypothetical protein
MWEILVMDRMFSNDLVADRSLYCSVEQVSRYSGALEAQRGQQIFQ